MDDNCEYISKKECIENGYIRENGCFYKMSVLEKYLKKGWLDYGDKKYSGKDRYSVGLKFYGDYMKGRFSGMMSCSLKNALIDCKNGFETDALFEVRDRYLKAVKSIPREFWEVVRKVCIENEDLNAGECLSERRRLEITFSLKKDLCRGLDRLIEHYLELR